MVSSKKKKKLLDIGQNWFVTLVSGTENVTKPIDQNPLKFLENSIK